MSSCRQAGRATRWTQRQPSWERLAADVAANGGRVEQASRDHSLDVVEAGRDICLFVEHEVRTVVHSKTLVKSKNKKQWEKTQHHPK